jgi:hypothetical protein
MNNKIILNNKLIERQKIDEKVVEKIKSIHRKRIKLFNQIEKENDSEKLKLLAKKIDDIEYDLQDAWGFPRDNKFHSWWYRMPKCTCAKLDNQERLGCEFKVINESCPLHGRKIKSEKEC